MSDLNARQEWTSDADWASRRFASLSDAELWNQKEAWAQLAAKHRGALIRLLPSMEHHRVEYREAAWWFTQLATGAFRELISRPDRDLATEWTVDTTHRVDVKGEIGSPYQWWVMCDICGAVVDLSTPDLEQARSWAEEHTREWSSGG